MARSPFQGTFQPNARPTVATAPDAVVYINGEAETIGCPQCARTFDVNKYITSIQTNLSVDSPPGDASITLAVPRHAIDDFYFDGNPVITTMMEVEIYAKGHYLVEGLPQYYPIFWGIITEVSDSYSGGEHTVSIRCADILKWWEICKLNINPAFTVPAGQLGVSLFGNVFNEMNPYDVIFTLATASFGDVIVGTGSTKQLVREHVDAGRFSTALQDMMMYWERRFSRMRSNLVLYGTSGVAVRGDTLYQEYSKDPTATHNRQLASTAVREANGSGNMIFNPASEKVVAFKKVFANASPGGFLQSEYQTKLELAVAAKEAIGFEFFMDVTGDIVFKPPFYNLDVLSNKPTSWIQDIDVINWDFSESETDVVTQIVMQGAWNATQEIGTPGDIHPFTTVTDYHLLRKYGWRSQNYNAEFIEDPTTLFFHGLDVLDKINSKRHHATLTIPMRTELRLGFPIYLAPKDQIWYVSGISHSIQFGGRATTDLQLTARRGKFIAPRGIGDLKFKPDDKGPIKTKDDGEPKSFDRSSQDLAQNGVFTLNVGNAVEMPADTAARKAKGGEDNPAAPLILRHPKTGRIVGYPNVVMAYSRPFSPDDVENVDAHRGEKTAKEVQAQVSEAEQAEIKERRAAYDDAMRSKITASRNSILSGKYLTNTYQYGLNAAGVFVYAHDSTPKHGVIREVLILPTSKVEVIPTRTANPSSAANPLTLIRPVSDERGFEVIGHYQYGRRISLRDGRLITTNPDKAARVDVQLALSGGLAALLTAQSQGLTSVITGYADPGATLATMTAEEGQSAAAFPGVENNPNVKMPVFEDLGDNFVGNAPLGSPEQRGTSLGVEATQLSRALSLAELSVKDLHSVPDEDCVCIMSRGDLAFMSSDYQVKVLSGSASHDNATLQTQLQGGPILVHEEPEALRAVNLYEAQMQETQTHIDALTERLLAGPEDLVTRQLLLEARATLNSLTQSRDAAQKELSELNMTSYSPSILTKTKTEVTSRVERFLMNLYKLLDDAHVQYESAIRGELLPKSYADYSNLNAPDTNPPSEFAPPFSAPGRFQLGDAKATVGSVQSNVSNLANTWGKFGNDLKTNSERQSWSTQLSQDKASISRLSATRDRLSKQRDSSTKVVGVDVQKQIDHLSSEIAKLEQKVAQNQAKLSGM